MRVFIEDSFDAAHWLPNVPDGHKCRRLHGHTYRVRIEISGGIGEESGYIMDYSEAKRIWGEVKEQLDHRCLNEIPGLENSTCELLTQWIWEHLKVRDGLPTLAKLEVRETEHCGCVKQ